MQAEMEIAARTEVVVCSSTGHVELFSICNHHMPPAPAPDSDGSTAADIAGKAEIPNVTGIRHICGVTLPGELFSSPVFVDQWVLMGCRDDHLYCLRLE